jgi:GAF domain-containing protein
MPAVPGEPRKVVWVAYDITERKNLETKIEESLERRGRQVQLSTHIAQVIAAATDLDDLYRRVVTEVKEQFGYFHVQLFSYDARSEMLKLAAGYGEIGRQMLRERYQLALGVGLAGQAAKLGQTILRPDLEQQPDSAPHRLLAEAKGAIAVPVKLGDAVLGVLSAKVEKPNVLDEEDQLVLEGLCGQIAIAIENTRLLEQVQRRAVELQTVAQVSAMVSTTLDVDKLLQTVVDLTKVSFNLYHAHVYLVNETQDTLVLAAGADQVGRRMVEQGWRIPLSRSDSLVAQAFRGRTGVISNEVESDPGFMPNPLLPETRSELAVPLLINQRVLGVLDVQSNIPNRFRDDDLQIMSTLATQVAIALENARLFEEERKFATSIEGQVTRLSLLNELGAALSAVSSALEALEVVAGKAAEIIEGDRVTITLLNPAGTHLEYYTLHGIGGPLVETVPIHETLTGRALATGKIVVISDLDQEDHPSARKLCEQGLHSLLIAPLMGWGHALGSVNIASRRPKAYDARDEGLAQQISSLLASTIENRRLFEQTQLALAETETLYDLGSVLTTASSLDEVLQVVISPDIHSGMASAVLFTIDVNAAGQPEGLVLATSWSRSGEYVLPSDSRYDLQDYPGAEVWLENPQELLLVKEVSSDERLSEATRLKQARLGLKAFIQLPLKLGQTWVGLIGLHWTSPQQFSEKDVRLYQSLAYQTAVVVNNLLLFEQTQAALSETAVLYRVAQAIVRLDDEQAIYEFVLTEYLAILGLKQGGVLIIDEREPYLSTLSALMVNGKLVEAGKQVPIKGNPASELVLETRKPLAITNALTDPLLAPVRSFVKTMGYKSLLLVPIVVRGRVFGMLGADSTEEIRKFTEREIALVQGIADQLGIAIENRRLLVETRAALAEVEALQRRYTIRAWETYRDRTAIKGYERIGDALMPVTDDTEADIDRILVHKRNTVVPGMPPLAGNGKPAGPNGPDETVAPNKPKTLVVPLKVRNEAVGHLGIENQDRNGTWLPEEIAFIEAIASQMAQAAENIRLLDESQQQAARERLTRQITDKMRQAPDIQSIIEAGMAELANALGASRAYVKLTPDPDGLSQGQAHP